MKPTDLVKRVDELVAMGKSVHATRTHVQNATYYRVDFGRIKGFRSAVLSFIEQHYGPRHTHYVEFSKAVDGQWESDLLAGLAILEAIHAEFAGGWLVSIKSLVAGEIFADFIEMAEHLLNSGYKDPAAVIAGGVLEEHLRQLCTKSGIETERDEGGRIVPKKADALNSDLTKAAVYGKLDQKSVTSWLDLRNNAAHGKYSEYETAQVDLMIKGVTDFLLRNPTA